MSRIGNLLAWLTRFEQDRVGGDVFAVVSRCLADRITTSKPPWVGGHSLP